MHKVKSNPSNPALAELSLRHRRTVASVARRLRPEFDQVGLAMVVDVAVESCQDLRDYPDDSLDELVERVTRQRLSDRVLDDRPADR